MIFNRSSKNRRKWAVVMASGLSNSQQVEEVLVIAKKLVAYVEKGE